MIAEILATGDEVRSGTIVDSNSAYIAERLAENGIYVTRHNCVGDDLELLAAVFKEIAGRADVALVTGGLGPTQDDLSSAAAAKACGVELVLQPEALKGIEAFFKARNRRMNPSNKKQALFPACAEWIPNPVGTAPGFSLKIGTCTFFFMPGVPAEMRRMLNAEVIPRLIKGQGGERLYYQIRAVAVFGLPESGVGERLAGFETEFPELKLGLRAKFPEIHVRLYGQDRTEAQLETTLARAADWVFEKLGDSVFSAEGKPMEAVVGDLLVAKKATLALAESCTGGLISHLLTNVAGSSRYFRFSGVTYSNEAKMDVLGVLPETLETYGAVHEKTVVEMAAGAKRVGRTDYGLATSGIAGPEGGSPEKPVGTLCVGLATPKGVFGRRFMLQFGKRTLHKALFAMSALDLLRRELIS